MKKCPTCDKTFADELKFCQADGTPLVSADEEPMDPYKTMVANQADLQVPSKEEATASEPAAESAPAPEPAKAADGDVLELPDEPQAPKEDDPMKTMVAGGKTAQNVKVDVPEPKEAPSAPPAQAAPPSQPEPEKQAPAAPPPPSQPSEPEAKAADDTPREEKPEEASQQAEKQEAKPAVAPEPPKFEEPKVAPPDPTGALKEEDTEPPKEEVVEEKEAPAPPPSPFEEDEEQKDPSAPIPSPFADSMPPGYSTPSTPPFDPSEDVKPEKVASTMDESAQSGDSGDWEPPAPLEASAGSDVSSGSSDSPPATGQNSTVAIVSLITGILSMTICCSAGILLGPAAAIMGFMAKGWADSNPEEYGGRGLALGGLITGIIGFLFGIILIVLQFLGAFANALQ